MNFDITPNSVDELVFGDANSKTLLTSITSGAMPFPFGGKTAFMLYGVFGTGKTTAASIICDELEMALSGAQLNAQPHWTDCDGTDSFVSTLKIVEQQRQLVSFNKSGLHYFIFDEVDNLTALAQRKLKLFLNHKNVVCVFTTNYLHKVDEGVRDRCFLLNFNAGSYQLVLERVKSVLVANHLPLPDDQVLLQRISNTDGSWRDIWAAVASLVSSLQPSPPNRAARAVKSSHLRIV